jgi:hypothetical protein
MLKSVPINESREPTFCHHVVRLRSDMTIAELFAEWFRLLPEDKNDEFGDHSECRYERQCSILEDLIRRRAKSLEDLLFKWKMARANEDDANKHYDDVPTLVGLFEWRGCATGHDPWSVQAAFSDSLTSELLRSILEDLERLTKDSTS